jgi:subtilisin family serine protease
MHRANDRVFSVGLQDEPIRLPIRLPIDPVSQTDGASPNQATQRDSTVQVDTVPRGLDRIDQVSLPLDGRYKFSWDGSGVTVFVIDTGLRVTHRNFHNTTSCGFDIYDPVYNYVNASIPRARCLDGLDHGTHVAGTVGGQISGVAKNVKLVGVTVFDNVGRGSRSSVVLGIDYVIGQKKANPDAPMVINMSLDSKFSRFVNEMAEAAVDAGIVVVAAAGNDHRSACQSSPASSKKVITVGSASYSELFRRDRKAFTSNYGRCVDIFA